MFKKKSILFLRIKKTAILSENSLVFLGQYRIFLRVELLKTPISDISVIFLANMTRNLYTNLQIFIATGIKLFL